jgi:phospholipase C
MPESYARGRSTPAFLVATACLAAGCATGASGTGPGDDGSGSEAGSPDASSGNDATSAATDGSAGAHADGHTGADASGDGGPGMVLPGTTPIKHVVVIVKENHTFDNYFGSFPGAEGTTQCQTSSGPVAAPKAPDKTPRDLCHEHSCALSDWNAGQMDGWLSVSGASSSNDNLFCAQYDGTSIPNYWAYAKKYALADHFFANVLGPSFPGHTFLLAAQAGWATGNPSGGFFWGCDESSSTTVPVLDPSTCTTQSVFPCFNIPSVPDLLPGAASWKFYGTNFYVLPEIWSMFDAIKEVRNGPMWSKVVNASTFDGDIDAKTLPSVSWLVDQDFADEHPNVGGVCAGENWTVGHVNKLMQSDYWKDSAIFFTMDDFGGWYDHVAPPRQYGCDKTQPYGLGFRLPLLILSPYVKPGVYKSVAEQASIVKFILEAFGAPRFLADMDPAAQDKQANDLMDAFDFTQPPLDPLVLQTRTCR